MLVAIFFAISLNFFGTVFCVLFALTAKLSRALHGLAGKSPAFPASAEVLC
jgi:hypothetical protein